ncbi:hypothetical protein JCM14720_20050 [Calditerricola yamamurae]
MRVGRHLYAFDLKPNQVADAITAVAPARPTRGFSLGQNGICTGSVCDRSNVRRLRPFSVQVWNMIQYTIWYSVRKGWNEGANRLKGFPVGGRADGADADHPF